MEFGREAVAEHLVKSKIPKLENLKLDLSGAIDGMMDFNAELDKISKDIQKRKDNAMAMEFVKVIGGMLVQNGVSLKTEECRDENIEMNMAKNKIEVKYNVRIDGLDFSEHDKPFEDEIKKREEAIKYYRDSLSGVEKNCDKLYHENKELKQRIAELESKETVDLPFDALETANYLINATYERETSSFERSFAKVPDKVNDDRYTVDELEQIAEHLLVYCKHNKGCEE